jgi:hypothetical protein
MNEQVVIIRVLAFSLPFSTAKDGDRGRRSARNPLDSGMAAGDPLDRWRRRLGRELHPEGEKVRAVVPDQLGRRGVRAHR